MTTPALARHFPALPTPLLIPTPTAAEALAYCRHLFRNFDSATPVIPYGTISTHAQRLDGIRDVLFIWEGHRYRLSVWWEQEGNSRYLYGEW